MGRTTDRTPVGDVSPAAAVSSDRKSALRASLDHDLEAVRTTVRDHFGERVRAITLGGSFGRGEGCFWDCRGTIVPGNNLNVFLVTSEPLSDQELESARNDILGRSLVESVVLVSYVEEQLPGLPLTLETLDFRESQRLVDGDPSRMEGLPAYDTYRFPLWEAEKQLRDRLVTLIEAYPRGKATFRSYYHASKSIFAGVDAFLIRNNCYTSSYRDKVHRLEGLVGDEHLLRLVSCALEIKLQGRTPPEYDLERFWTAAARFQVDSHIGLLRPKGVHRRDRLADLLSVFHYQTTSKAHTLRNLLKIFLQRNHRGNAERLLLGLVVDRDPESPGVDLDEMARRARLPAGQSPEELLHAAIEHWYSLRRLR